MSAIGPQFHEFIKKLEENNDKLPSSTTSRLFQPEYEFDNSTCYLCNGYYGPSFGEPVCVACHAFLYPDIPSNVQYSCMFSEKTEDGDSGNDEPSELMYNDRRFIHAMQMCLTPKSWPFGYEISLDSETSPEDESSPRNGGPYAAGPSRMRRQRQPFSSCISLAPYWTSVVRCPPAGSRYPAGPSRENVPFRDQAQSPPGPSRDAAIVAAGSSGDVGGPSRNVEGPPELVFPTDRELLGLLGPSDGNRADPALPVENGPANEIAPVDESLEREPASNKMDEEEEETLPPWSVARALAALSTPRLPDNLAPGLVESLPSEVLLCMFSYLDDMSLCACALVCARWWRLVRAQVSQERWEEYALRRWPLLRAMVTIQDWHKKYQALVESCFCRHCLVQMCVLWQPDQEENAWRRNRLRNELKMLRNDPPEGCAAMPLDPKCCHWQAVITGPVGSPYEGGIFYLYIQVPFSYPMRPPVVRFLTRILHPNVSRHGDVGIDSVHHNWSLALTISKILVSIQSLLTDPYTTVSMEPGVAALYDQDRVKFERIARRWTWQYAMHEVLLTSPHALNHLL